MSIKIQIKTFTLAQKQQLAEKWQYLEKRSNCSVFLSWLWIGNWLDLVIGKLFIVECYQDDEIVGLAFFVEKTRKIFGVIPIKQWWLHRTGEQDQDQIWIEYNDFLLSARNESLIREQMVKAIAEHSAVGDELIVGLSENKVLTSFDGSHFTGSRELITSKGYLIDFKLINNDYFKEILSKNARYQINRSEKLLKEQGELGFRVVNETADIKALLPDIAKLHIKRWQDTVEGSGFDNEIFSQFHQRLIEQSASSTSTVQVAVLSLEDKNIGYLLNFVYKNTVSFYLSALSDDFDAKIKVGLLLHTKAIKYYASHEVASHKIEKYDFLAGDAQYKRTLSNSDYALDFICFNKNKAVLSIEALLRGVKARILKR